jgi:hypothetical protein
LDISCQAIESLKMSLEEELSALSHDEKLAAMELLWREFSREPLNYSSPLWHEEILAGRLASPAKGERLSLPAAKAEVMERLRARPLKH